MILTGDSLTQLQTLQDRSIQCCVTSPPYYGLRDYGVDGQIGLEETPEEFIGKLVEVFREVRRVLADDGTLWVNMGDSYWGGKGASSQAYSTTMVGKRNTINGAQHQIAGKGETRPTDKRHLEIKPKDLIGIPWMLAFALRADGWYLRQDIIWHKPNPMPESVRDRCTKAHEYIFLLSKGRMYFYDAEAVKEDAVKGFAGSTFNTGKTAEHQLGRSSDAERIDDGRRNRRSVWTVSTKPFKGAHFATFPPDLIEPCILAGSRPGDTVLDPFSGAGTTGLVALKHGRKYIGIELNPEYVALQEQRLAPYRATPLLSLF